MILPLDFRKVLVALFFFSSVGTTQPNFAVKYRLNGPAGSHFGWSVSKIGDVNGDSLPDILVGAPQASPDGKPAAGSVFVYSGAGGELILRKDGAAAGDRFGQICCGLGDIDGDGKGGFAVGLPEAESEGKRQAGLVAVFSGAKGNRLYSLAGSAPFELFGQTLCRLGDLNKDGRDDFAVGSPNALQGLGSVKVFSGQEGRLLFQVVGRRAGEFLQVCAPAGDFNGDGTLDLLVGFPSLDWNGIKRAGVVRIYSGASSVSGNMLFETGGWIENQNMGLHTSGVGDIDKDRLADFIVGLPIDCHNGEAFVYTAKTGFHLSHPKDQFCHFGEAVADVGDVDRDGRDDFVVGSPNASPEGRLLVGHLRLYSGATIKPIFDLKGTEPHSRLGFSIAALGDVDGDGWPEFAVGVPYASSTDGREGGQVWVITPFLRGDLNLDGELTIADLYAGWELIFFDCPIKAPLAYADLDDNGLLTAADFMLLLKTISAPLKTAN